MPKLKVLGLALIKETWPLGQWLPRAHIQLGLLNGGGGEGGSKSSGRGTSTYPNAFISSGIDKVLQDCLNIHVTICKMFYYCS